MKKYLLGFLLILIATPLFAGSGVYLRGDINGWNANSKWEMEETGNGIYVLYNRTLSGEFKIADDSWGTINYGGSAYYGDVQEIQPNTQISAFYNGVNLSIKGNITFSKIIFNLKKLTITFEKAGSGIFLRGDLNYNEAVPYWEMIDEGNSVYSLYNKTLSGKFKFGDSNWKDLNLGVEVDDNKGYKEISPEEKIRLKLSGKYLYLSKSYNFKRISLDLKTRKLTFELASSSGDEFKDPRKSGIYLRGEINDWKPVGEWEMTDEGDGKYVLYNKTLSGNFKIGDSKWDKIDYGGFFQEGSFDYIQPNELKQLAYIGGHLFLEKSYTFPRIIFDKTKETILLDTSIPIGSDDPTWKHNPPYMVHDGIRYELKSAYFVEAV